MQVEFLGIPRERAGVGELQIDAATLGQVLDELSIRFPALREFITDGRLHPACAANLNGDAFVCDRDTRLDDADHLIILSSDVGG